jgi:hypothetical protein
MTEQPDTVAKTRAEEEHEDCLDMQRVIKEKLGIEVSVGTCMGFWAEHSELNAAGWLCTHDDAEVISAFSNYGPFAQIENIYSEIKGLDRGFRLMLLSKIDERICRNCGEEYTILCMKCRSSEEDETQTAGDLHD